VIRVHVLQVNTVQVNIDELTAAVEAGHTDADGWQMPKAAAPGDLVVWYAAGRQLYIARGWVESAPVKVARGFGPYRGQVAGIQRIDPPVDRIKVLNACGVNGGIQGSQTVSDGLAVDFLRSLGLMA
jgi:hypothetical protein